ncbi:MAG: inorganic pyrophosphatase [Ruminococcaceae bacterium]|nr:inorganic pyrophosphatase [Oscillospiraceae bacterium]
MGKTVSGIIDRPLGIFHPRISTLYYSVNYGYVEGIMGGDGAEQDIYYLGEDKPVAKFSGKVIAVVHRFNDVEDKWIVAKDGCQFTKEEIENAVEFQEKFFDSEVIMP